MSDFEYINMTGHISGIEIKDAYGPNGVYLGASSEFVVRDIAGYPLWVIFNGDGTTCITSTPPLKKVKNDEVF